MNIAMANPPLFTKKDGDLPWLCWFARKGMYLWTPPQKKKHNIYIYIYPEIFNPSEMKVDIPKTKGFRSAMQSYSD